MLVMASSLSPTNMAESYCALLSASWRQSRRNFSMFGCEEDMATPRFLEAILINRFGTVTGYCTNYRQESKKKAVKPKLDCGVASRIV